MSEPVPPLDMAPDAVDPAVLVGTSDAFRAIPASALERLAGAMTTATLADGQVLVAQNERADALYVVLAGTLAAATVDRHGVQHGLEDVRAGETAGEVHIVSTGIAAETLTARGPVQIAALSREAFDRFSHEHPAAGLAFVDALQPKLRQHRMRSALHRSDMFGHVDRAALADLEAEFELVALYGGERLFRQGDAGDCLYIVVSGRLRVVNAAPDGSERLLAELGPGETVGEMAVLSGEPRSATVYAMRDTQLAKLSSTAVRRVMGRHPDSMLVMLTSRLVARVRTMSSGARQRADVTTIALAPANPGIPLTAFAGEFSRALSRLGSVLHLNGGIVDRALGRPGAAQAHERDAGGTGLVEWLAAQEIEHRYIVYETDLQLSPWTERCIRQADRVVLVADASGDAAPGEIETELLARGPGRRTPVTLALLHAPETTAPSGTARWLAGRTVERHLHVKRGRTADLERLSRFITGTAVGLALGGGFARGLAHLGVLRALDEHGIAVDAIGGASMGAMVGGQWACGFEPARIVHEMRTGFAESFDDMTLPFLAFKRGGKVGRFMQALFGDVRIEDLWTPYFCVSANLNRAELKIHTRDRLADAVLASSRAPGIFPPVVFDGELHVDGGLINNVPVDVMKPFANDGIVIGVDVSPPHELNQVHDYGYDVPGWRAIWNRFNPARDKRIYRPSILLVLMRVIEFGGISYRREKAEMADVYISPEVLRFKRNDFQLADDIGAAGYDATVERLRDWLTGAPDVVRRRRPDIFGASAAWRSRRGFLPDA